MKYENIVIGLPKKSNDSSAIEFIESLASVEKIDFKDFLMDASLTIEEFSDEFPNVFVENTDFYKAAVEESKKFDFHKVLGFLRRKNFVVLIRIIF